ncbi:MAG: 50S ribosomal protein L17 [Chloroflexi bacterium]|nr:50S ribosomal protein L17 [Chloroflexota bacterium]
MRHKLSGKKLGRPAAHRWSLYRNLVTDLLNYGKISTTLVKAKEARGLADKMITLGKEGGLASRRRALAFIFDEKVVDKVFGEYSTRYKSRPGGYTRVLKLGMREGDRAPMALIEMVE